MQLTFVHFLIVCPLVFLAGFVDSIAGGGGLISLPAYMIAGLPTVNSIATNKISSCMGTTVATAKYAKEGYIKLKIAIPCVIFALIGSSCGAKIAILINERYFKIAMLIVLPLTAIFLSKASIFKKELVEDAEITIKSIILACIVSFFLGIYDGVYGPGTGTFLIIMLTAIVGLSMTSANGVAKAINLATNVGALIVYLPSGNAIIPLGVAAGVFNMIGAYLGTSLFKKKGGASVKPVMYVVLAIFFVKVAYELFFQK